MIRVVIVDDQDLVREGLVAIAGREGDIRVVGTAESGREGLQVIRAMKPDVAVVDIRMPNMNGLELSASVVRAALPTKILVLTAYDVAQDLDASVEAGASGFLIKDADPTTFRHAIRKLAAGEVWLDRAPASERARDGSPPDGTLPRGRHASLTEREREVLRLLGRGLSNREIASELVVAPSTVKTHVHRVLAKLGLRDRVQALLYVRERTHVDSMPLPRDRERSPE
ncbi:MAG: response regulator transcription factor [Myxococcota bacterium]